MRISILHRCDAPLQHDIAGSKELVLYSIFEQYFIIPAGYGLFDQGATNWLCLPMTSSRSSDPMVVLATSEPPWHAEQSSACAQSTRQLPDTRKEKNAVKGAHRQFDSVDGRQILRSGSASGCMGPLFYDWSEFRLWALDSGKEWRPKSELHGERECDSTN